MHFALGAGSTTTEAAAILFAGCPALGATARLIGETFFRVEVLLRSSENEIGAALAAV